MEIYYNMVYIIDKEKLALKCRRLNARGLKIPRKSALFVAQNIGPKLCRIYLTPRFLKDYNYKKFVNKKTY